MGSSGNSFQFQRTKTFRAVIEKVHLAGVQQRRQFKYCKICTKPSGLSKDSQGRNIQNSALSWHAGLKNSKRPTCVYMIKNITQAAVINI